jgi:predicted Rossmann-fold nucleotide-binding protein
VFLLNLDGFYNPLIALLDHYVTTHMMEPQDRALVHAANSPEELVEMLNA